MKKELAHFQIGEALGGSQEWFLDPFMKLGGCGAVTACDTCIWLAREYGETWMYPFDPQNPSRKEFLHFGRIMKPYLRPRAGGINRLEMYIRGFTAYLRGREAKRMEAAEGRTGGRILRMEGLSGHESADTAWAAIQKQIDAGFPVPVLNLRHRDDRLKDFIWHWFLLCGYSDETELETVNPDETGKRKAGPVRKVKAVTYGEAVWIDFDGLWDTGHEEKGGLVLYRWAEESGSSPAQEE